MINYRRDILEEILEFLEYIEQMINLDEYSTEKIYEIMSDIERVLQNGTSEA